MTTKAEGLSPTLISAIADLLRTLYEGPWLLGALGPSRSQTQEALERIASLAVQAHECVWTPHDDEWSGVRWETACGHTFVFIDDGPAENETNFCCYCGGKLKQAERPPEETR